MNSVSVQSCNAAKLLTARVWVDAVETITSAADTVNLSPAAADYVFHAGTVAAGGIDVAVAKV